MSPVAVVRVGDEHTEALAEFYRKVWDPNATAAHVANARADAARVNPACPGEPPPTWLVLQDGHAIAHVTTIPIRLWLHGRDVAAHWIKGLWVLPEFQRSSAGFLLLRAAAGLTSPALALVHETAAIRLFQAVGYTDLGALPNRMRVLRARSLLAHIDVEAAGAAAGLSPRLRTVARFMKPAAPLLAPFVSLGNAVWSTMRTGLLAGLTTQEAEVLDESEVSSLWRAARGEIQAGPSRDIAQLAARYPAKAYVYVMVRSQGKLVGLAIVKRPTESGDPRLRGVRISSLSDVVYAPSDDRVGLALLRGAERAARRLEADALLCSASVASFNLLLRRRVYLPLPATLHVLARIPGQKEADPRDLAEWWVTRGDSEADGAF